MATKNDQVILNLKKKIEEKKTLLAEAKKFDPITNCNFQFNGDRYNIHTIGKEKLLLLIAEVKSLQNALKEVMPEETLSIGGYSARSWLIDLIAKYNMQNVSMEKKRLEALEKKLHNLLSNDTKVELEIEDLKNQIG